MEERFNLRQVPGEAKRRWFHSDDFDLIVWLGDDLRIVGFELCYDKRGHERSISWREQAGFAHMAVDDGEQRPGKHKASPILVPDGVFQPDRICAEFREASRLLPQEIAEFVLRILAHYPDT